MDITTENRLLEKIKNNDLQAENELISHFLPRVQMIVSQRIYNREDRPEIVNDVFMGLLIKLREGSFDPERGSGLSAYINGIVHNSITQYLKNYYNEHSRRDKINEHLKEKFDDIGNNEDSYEERESTENQRELWRKLISDLKPKYKEAIYLRFYKNLSVIEIAKKMNTTPQKVSDYIKYSKKLLLNEASKKKNKIFMPVFFQIFLGFSNICVEFKK